MPLTRWIEGRISAAKRKRGLRHCLNHGRSGFVYWIGWGMIAADLTMIDHALERTPSIGKSHAGPEGEAFSSAFRTGNYLADGINVPIA
jgi:hypothetical protein